MLPPVILMHLLNSSHSESYSETFLVGEFPRDFSQTWFYISSPSGGPTGPRAPLWGPAWPVLPGAPAPEWLVHPAPLQARSSGSGRQLALEAGLRLRPGFVFGFFLRLSGLDFGLDFRFRLDFGLDVDLI